MLIEEEQSLLKITKDMAAFNDIKDERCKFGIAGGTLYKSWWIFSGIQRTFYRENRVDVCKYIDKRCNGLLIIHNTALSLVSKSQYRRDALILLADCKKLAGIWLKGITIFETEYLQDKIIVDSIINIKQILENIRTSIVE